MTRSRKGLKPGENRLADLKLRGMLREMAGPVLPREAVALEKKKVRGKRRLRSVPFGKVVKLGPRGRKP